MSGEPRTLRAALTETCNVYQGMPESRESLAEIADRVDDIRATNLEHHAELIALAAGAGARLVGLGELFPFPYFALEKNPIWIEAAEDAFSGPTVTRMRAAAREHAVVVVAPIYELDGASGRRFNTAVIIDAAGEVVGRYRKAHIPTGVNEEGEFHETFYYQASDGELGDWPRNVSSHRYFPVFDIGLCKLGVAICYDRHFPNVMKALAENGAELVLSPAVTFGTKSRRMWELEFQVDAAREKLFIGASNRRGSEPPWNQRYFGASHFVGPNGRPPHVHIHPNLVVADLDFGELYSPDPSGWDLHRDRRPDIY